MQIAAVADVHGRLMVHPVVGPAVPAVALGIDAAAMARRAAARRELLLR